jgi:hypothetical protein
LTRCAVASATQPLIGWNASKPQANWNDLVCEIGAERVQQQMLDSLKQIETVQAMKCQAIRHGSNEGNSQEVILAAAEIALFAAREYPNGSCRTGKRARLAVAIVTSALPSFEPWLLGLEN